MKLMVFAHALYIGRSSENRGSINFKIGDARVYFLGWRDAATRMTRIFYFLNYLCNGTVASTTLPLHRIYTELLIHFIRGREFDFQRNFIGQIIYTLCVRVYIVTIYSLIHKCIKAIFKLNHFKMHLNIWWCDALRGQKIHYISHSLYAHIYKGFCIYL